MSSGIIKDAIRQIAGTHLKDDVNIMWATVTSVDITTRSCKVQPLTGKGTAPLENVMLMAALDDGILPIPSVGSVIIVAHSTYTVPFVILFSKLDKIFFVAGNNLLTMDGQNVIITNGKNIIKTDGTTITFNDGSFGGMVEVANLVIKLNNLENLLNDLITKYNSHTHILSLSSGTGTAAPTTTTETGTIAPVTQRSDIENTTIIHGK